MHSNQFEIWLAVVKFKEYEYGVWLKEHRNLFELSSTWYLSFLYCPYEFGSWAYVLDTGYALQITLSNIFIDLNKIE